MIVEIFLGILLVLLLWKFFKKPSNYPPGPWGVPLLGAIPLTTNFEGKLAEYHKKYGGVIMWRIGVKKIVFISDFDLAKESYNTPVFSYRPKLVSQQMLYSDKNYGVVGSNGLAWQRKRRFALHHLRNFGMGKSKLVTVVQHQADDIVKKIKESGGEPIEVPDCIFIAVLNIIWSMIASKQYSLDDEFINDFGKMIINFFQNAARNSIPDFLPWTKYLMPKFLYKKLTAHDELEILNSQFIKLIKEIIGEIKSQNIDANNPQNFIEAYLAEKQKNDEENDDDFFHDDDLIVTVHDLFIAGSTATKMVLHWSLYYLTSYPNVQKKIQNEIENVLPNRIEVQLEDKSRMSYVEAFTHEIHRHVSLVGTANFHEAAEDCELNGYLIPKGSLLSINSTQCHYDPKFWKNPEVFDPERFLDSDGNFMPPKEGYLPFGTGKRMCAGESLVQMEIFIILVKLIQNFEFSVPPGKVVDLKPFKGHPFAHMVQEHQKLIFTER